MTIIAPSILAADFGNLEREFVRIHQSDAEWIHCDIMDGVFVPNISFGFPVLASLRNLTPRVLDVHLMLSEPIKYIKLAVESGADAISFHIEANSPTDETLLAIRNHGKLAGLVINPETSVESIEPYTQMIDYLLIMSVYPGFGWQKFIETTYEKVERAKAIRKFSHTSFLIEVDGGVNQENAHKLRKSGADILVSGSALFSSSDFSKYIHRLRYGIL